MWYFIKYLIRPPQIITIVWTATMAPIISFHFCEHSSPYNLRISPLDFPPQTIIGQCLKLATIITLHVGSISFCCEVSITAQTCIFPLEEYISVISLEADLPSLWVEHVQVWPGPPTYDHWTQCEIINHFKGERGHRASLNSLLLLPFVCLFIGVRVCMVVNGCHVPWLVVVVAR